MSIQICKYFSYPKELRITIDKILVNISLEWSHFRHKKDKRKIIIIDKYWIIPEGVDVG